MAVRRKPSIERQRKTQAERRRELTRQGQEIGPLPRCKDTRRRKACYADFGLFCKTYLPEIFYLKWSKDLEKVIRKIERVVIDHDKLAVAMPRGSGKALALDTPLPTPSGWTTMGRVAPGDVVYGADGRRVSVTFCTPVMEGHPCFRVTFDDGESITCDADHLWTVDDRYSRQNPITLRTADMAGRVVLPNRRRGFIEHRYSIPICSPIDGQSRRWHIEPYILGSWLGDGTSKTNEITIGDADLSEMRRLIERHEKLDSRGRRKDGALAATYCCGSGYGVGHRGFLTPATIQKRFTAQKLLLSGRSTAAVCAQVELTKGVVEGMRSTKTDYAEKPSLRVRLGWLNLINNKHIPMKYLRASQADRMELLRGLMDTDGSISKNGSTAEYVTKLVKLRDDVMDLLAGLGFKRRWREKVINGRTYYRITFTPSDGRIVFGIKRKSERQEKRDMRISGTRRIVAIRSVPSVPVRCIQVDAPDDLYLCGSGMIPTHNTRLCQAAVMWATLTGRHKFVVLIGAVAAQAADAIVWFKKTLSENLLLIADFPEVCMPIRLLDNESKRCLGQRHRGVKTNIRWAKDRIVLPTIPGSVASGSVIEATSLEGHIRGAWAAMPGGKVIRPTLAICDDPQTPEALAVDTPILTPRGFVKMAEIRVGDFVFGENGHPCKVMKISEWMVGRPCYLVTFDDGASVVADAEHKWVTSNGLQRTNARRRRNKNSKAFRHPKPTSSLVTTEQMLETLIGEGGRSNHSIPLTSPIECKKSNLPIPPYTLGAWLGDGTTASGGITTMDEEILERIRSDGFNIGKYSRKQNNKAWSCTILGLRTLLRENGILGCKKIPREYILADRQQRLDLLRGLMDTDGTVHNGKTGVKGTRCSFSNTNRNLVDGVLYLCRSFGIKAKVSANKETRANAAPSWLVTFITSLPVFNLERKLSRLPTKTKPSVRRRYVISINPVPSVPVKCICVDNPSRMYLCGEGLIPTHNSARSQGPSGQTTYRLQVINQDVQGLAGPEQQTAILVPCTVICPGDLADQLLDRRLHPDYRGERTKRIYSWPSNKALWEQYRELRESAMQDDQPLDDANEFYRSHQATCGVPMDEPRDCANCPVRESCMDRDALVDWAERLDDPRNLSAVQAAMHAFWKYGASGFAAEFQNEPLTGEGSEARLTAAMIQMRYSGRARFEVPIECTELTMFVDVQQSSLWYVVAAWHPNFTGHVIDYGVWPQQNRTVFTLQEVADGPNSLQVKYPGRGVEGTIQAGLEEFITGAMQIDFHRAGGGGLMRIGRVLVDSGKWPGTIASVKHKIGTVMMLSKGVGIRAGNKPMSTYKRKKGERHGHHWYIPTTQNTREFPYVAIDVNYWKSFVHGALLTAPGDPGALTLFGDNPDLHALLAGHLTAETYVGTRGHGRDVQEWTIKPQRPDNHWFDCMVGAACAASIQGVTSPSRQEPRQGVVRRKRVPIDELMARRERKESTA